MKAIKCLNRIFKFISKLVFPPACVFCGRILEINSKINTCGQCGKYIQFCSDCVCCVKCGKPIIGYTDKKRCYFCNTAAAKYFDRIISVFIYEDLVRNSIIRFKAEGYCGYADTFSDCMAAKFFEEYSDIKFDFFCGVPSNARENNKKIFDQVELLGNNLGKKINLEYRKNVFKYMRKTEKQSTLGYDERQKNMKCSLEVFENIDVTDKTVLLIDDICTTRATIIECSRALKKAGAKHVFALTLATVKNPD